MHRSFLSIVLISLVAGSLLAVPVNAQDAPGDLAQLGQHSLTYTKSATDATVGVVEEIQFVNRGESDFSDALWFDLDPDATLRNAIVADAQNMPFDGAGALTAEDFNTTEGDTTTRHMLDLGALGVTIAPEERFRVTLLYQTPAEDRDFVRGFAYGVPILDLQVFLPNGQKPAGGDLQNVPRTSLYIQAADADTAYAPGETFTFSVEDTDTAAVPLEASLDATGDEEITLSVDVRGGIAPYTIRWFHAGDEIASAEGQEQITVGADEAGRYRVEVTDSAAPPTTESAGFAVVRAEGAAVPAPGAADGNIWLYALVGVVLGALLVYGLVAGGVVGPKPKETRPSDRSSISAESREMLEARKRTNMAALKELEIAKKKGEVAEGHYLPLKEELKSQTVRVMRELEKREKETV